MNKKKAGEDFYFLETKYGGHVGFMSSFNSSENKWLENQILAFIKDKVLITL
mgnify:CR=1 FL=1